MTMKISDTVPYLAYALLILLLGLAVQALLEAIAPDSDRWLNPLVLYCVVTPSCLFVARRVGRIGYRGLFVTSALLLFLTYFAIVTILDQIAKPAGGSVGWSDLFTTGGGALALNSFMALAVPLFWLAVLRRFSPRSDNGRTAPAVI